MRYLNYKTKIEYLFNTKNKFTIKILLRIFAVTIHTDCHEKKLYSSFCNSFITKHILPDSVFYSLVWSECEPGT